MSSRLNIRLTPRAPLSGVATVNLPVSATAQTLATMGLTLSDTARYVQVQLENDSLRYCPDGTTPVPATPLGFLMQAGEIREFSRQEAMVAKFIRNNAGTACSVQIYQCI